MNPSLPESVVTRAMERDAAAASAEYMAEFRSDLERFLTVEAVQDCVMPGVRELPPQHQPYIAFVDPSGGSADSMTMGIAFRAHDKGGAILACIRERRPPFSPAAVVAEFVETLRLYGVSEVRGDAYGAVWVQESFQKLGIGYRLSDKNRSQIYSELLPAINSREVSLLDDRRLVAQLTGLERRTARSGKDTIDHPPNQHDDVANAAAGDVRVVEQIGNTSNFARTDRIFLAAYPRTANPAAAAEGDSVTVAFTGLELPATYSVVVSGLSQVAIATVTNRTFSGFSVVLNPLSASVTLVSGFFDCLVFA
jgi:hypothetical protein